MSNLLQHHHMTVCGMKCRGCVSKLETHFGELPSAEEVHVEIGSISAKGLTRRELVAGVRAAGFDTFHWRDSDKWKTAAFNTTFCLLGCSLGEFGTLAVYGAFDLQRVPTAWYVLLCILPVLNGLLTSVLFETTLLVRQGLSLRASVHTAIGMSFISMVIMEAGMEGVDMLATRGQLGVKWEFVPFALLIGYLAPLPYNYYRLKKLGKACH